MGKRTYYYYPLLVGMSIDHKPNNEGEQRRIEAAGGVVHMKRVDGDLAVSRAIGDFTYKQNKALSPGLYTHSN